MSMLAEPKRKQKWALNPRGKAWSQDANKFGQKMLEKMGWQHGKGLGANENGITEHIKMTYKNDSQGMGYKETDDQWTEHESNFSALLKSLTGNQDMQPDDIKLNSLEKKSQSSKVRVHYHKFTRGKDLTRYSEKDLANIFGKKSLKVIKKEKIEEDEENNSQETNHSFIVNSGSMRDYFKKKLPGFGKHSSYVIGSNGVLKKEQSDSEDELKTCGFGYHTGSQVKVTQEKNVEDNKSNNTFVSYVEDYKKRKLVANDDNIFSPRKKLKKNKRDNQTGGLTNPAFEPLGSHLVFQKNTLTSIPESNTEDVEEIVGENQRRTTVSQYAKNNPTENSTKSNKKKSKKKKYSENSVVLEETDIICDIDEDKNPPKEKHSKKKKKLNILSEENLEHIVEETADEETSKTKNVTETTMTALNLQCIFDNPNFNEDADSTIDQTNIASESNPYEVKPKLKKRKKAKSGIDNMNFINMELETTTNITEVENNPYEVKPKKRKNIMKRQTENIFELERTESKNSNKEVVVEKAAEESTSEITKSKKKKRKKEIQAIDNPSFNPNDSLESETQSISSISPSITVENNSVDIEVDDLMLNVISTPVILKKPNDYNISAASETESSIKRRKSVRFSDVTQELIIPNNDDLRRLEENEDIDSTSDSFEGIDNVNFDKVKNNLEENLETISNTIDRYQAEIENEINEQKQFTVEDFMIGEVGNPHGENEKLPIGTKLKFKYAHFRSKVPMYQQNKVGPKKSYKHLIKGDIILKFKNSNLHEIAGYASQMSKTST